MHLRDGESFASACGLTMSASTAWTSSKLDYHLLVRLQGTGLATEAAIAYREHVRTAARGEARHRDHPSGQPRPVTPQRVALVRTRQTPHRL